MEMTFDAIGFELRNENAFQDLADDVGLRGEPSLVSRNDGVLHGRCLKFGSGLEVWMQFYETMKGEVVYTNCRPAFRSRFTHKISPWIFSESGQEGKWVVHGFVEDSNSEVLFQLQNLTEVGNGFLNQTTLNVGLCGLAYRAEVLDHEVENVWLAYDEDTINIIENEFDWRLAGRIEAFEALKNPHSGNDLYWIYVDVGSLRLEFLVSQRALRGKRPRVGSFITADVWLQGHILTESVKPRGYEGIDWSTHPSDFWKEFKRPN
jgi:hypothetical protein